MRSRRRDERDDELAELAALADGSLAPERRAAVEERVAGSPELAGRLAEQEHAVALARSAAAEVEATPALRARIEAQRHERRVRRRPAVVYIGAAAAAALALVVAVRVVDSGTSDERLYAALAPTASVPGASGAATLTKTDSGWRVELDATGLPRLEGTRFYQAWLRKPDGVLVPIGTFNEARDVTLWAGVSPKVFTTLTVTRELADGDQESTGDRVLVGTVDAG
jgi:hypothetical protein